MAQDEILCSIAEDVKNFAVIYVVDITEVPDFNTMYELYDPCTLMFCQRILLGLHWLVYWSFFFTQTKPVQWKL